MQNWGSRALKTLKEKSLGQTAPKKNRTRRGIKIGLRPGFFFGIWNIVEKMPILLLISAFLFNCILPTDYLAWAKKTDTMPSPIGEDPSVDPGQVSLLGPNDIEIPPLFGSVKERFQQDTDPKGLIVHIQDLHTHYQAHKNIAGIIEHLYRKYGIKTILCEAKETDRGFAYLRPWTKEDIRKKVAEENLKEGVLTGWEALDLASDMDLVLQGIEDKDLYMKDMDSFLKAEMIRKDALNFVDTLNNVSDNLKLHVYSKAQRLFDQRLKEYREERLGLAEYAAYLKELAKANKTDCARFGNLGILLNTLALEKRIDFKKAEAERETLIRILSEGLKEDDLKTLLGMSMKFKANRISQNEFYKYLVALATRLKMDMKAYPNFHLYTQYIASYHDLNPSRLFEELNELENTLAEAIFTREDQKRLFQISKNLIILRGLVDFKLTPDEFDYYTRTKAGFDIEDWLKFLRLDSEYFKLNTPVPADAYIIINNIPILESFYKVARERDEAFVKNIDNQFAKRELKTAFLMTGGFHTPGVTSRLKEAGYSYIIVSPRIEEEMDYERYYKLLKDSYTALKETAAIDKWSSAELIDEIERIVGEIIEKRGLNEAATLQEVLTRGAVLVVGKDGKVKFHPTLHERIEKEGEFRKELPELARLLAVLKSGEATDDERARLLALGDRAHEIVELAGLPERPAEGRTSSVKEEVKGEGSRVKGEELAVRTSPLTEAESWELRAGSQARTSPMKLVTLRNGATEAEPLVGVTMVSLMSLLKQKPIVFYDLVMKARDPGHELWGQTANDLKALGLISENESMHESIRNIVLSAAEGEGFDMRLVSPIKSEAGRTSPLTEAESWELRAGSQARTSPMTAAEIKAELAKLRIKELAAAAKYILNDKEAQLFTPSVYVAGRTHDSFFIKLQSPVGKHQAWAKGINVLFANMPKEGRLRVIAGYDIHPTARPTVYLPSVTNRKEIPQLGKQALEAIKSLPEWQEWVQLARTSPMTEAEIQQLISGLQDKDVSVRKGVAWGLVNIGPEAKPAVPALIKALDDEDPGVQVYAQMALVKMGKIDESVVTTLASYLKSEDSVTRTNVAVVLGLVGPEAKAAIPTLMMALRDKDVSVRMYAEGALVRMGREDESVIPTLTPYLKSEDEVTREHTVGLLDRIGTIAKSAVPELKAALVNERSSFVRYSMERALIGITGEPASEPLGPTGLGFGASRTSPTSKEYIAELTERLRDKDADVRRGTAVILGIYGPEAKSAVPKLTPLLRDENLDVRASAARALGNIGPEAKSAVPELIIRLSDDLRNLSVIIAVQEALVKIGKTEESVVAGLTPLLKNENPNIRRIAAEALGDMGAGAKSAVPELNAALDMESSQLTWPAIRTALDRIAADVARTSPATGEIAARGQEVPGRSWETRFREGERIATTVIVREGIVMTSPVLLDEIGRAKELAAAGVLLSPDKAVRVTRREAVTGERPIRFAAPPASAEVLEAVRPLIPTKNILDTMAVSRGEALEKRPAILRELGARATRVTIDVNAIAETLEPAARREAFVEYFAYMIEAMNIWRIDPTSRVYFDFVGADEKLVSEIKDIYYSMPNVQANAGYMQLWDRADITEEDRRAAREISISHIESPMTFDNPTFFVENRIFETDKVNFLDWDRTITAALRAALGIDIAERVGIEGLRETIRKDMEDPATNFAILREDLLLLFGLGSDQLDKLTAEQLWRLYRITPRNAEAKSDYKAQIGLYIRPIEAVSFEEMRDMHEMMKEVQLSI